MNEFKIYSTLDPGNGAAGLIMEPAELKMDSINYGDIPQPES